MKKTSKRQFSENIYATRLPGNIAASIEKESEEKNIPVSKIVRQRIISGSLQNATTGNFFIRTKSGKKVPVDDLGISIEIS